MNIACIGRIGQGKSTGVNSILKTYKAKESTKGGTQTKNLTFYQVNNQPIRILDIPGFQDEKSVKEAIEKFKLCGEMINRIKDNLHIILYFLDYHNRRSFENLELPMIEEIIKHQSSKIIYVVTHYKKNDEDDEEEENKLKEDYIKKINSGIQSISENSKNNEDIKEFMKASLDNTIFVNFHDENFKEVGTKQLFNKIGEFFISTEDYLSSERSLSEDEINLRAAKLRERAKDVVKSNIFWGGLSGVLPGIDWIIQNFVIKKNAAKKIGQIYGIDVKFFEEKKEENNNNIESSQKIEILTGEEKSSVDIKMEMDGEKLTEADTKTKVVYAGKTFGQIGLYINGLLSNTNGSNSNDTSSTNINYSPSKFSSKVYYIFGAVFGIIVRGYMTYSFCNKLIDKFEKYYKENANRIANSYSQAKQYFISK